MGQLDGTTATAPSPTAAAGGPALSELEQKRAAAAKANAEVAEADAKAAKVAAQKRYADAMLARDKVIKDNANAQAAIDKINKELEVAQKAQRDLADSVADLFNKRRTLDRSMKPVPVEPKKPTE